MITGLEDVVYQEMFRMNQKKTREFFIIVVRYIKRNKKLIVGGEYVIFFYDKFYALDLSRDPVLLLL